MSKQGPKTFPQDTIYFALFIVNCLFIVAFQAKYLFIESIWSDEALYAWYANKIYINPLFIFSKQLSYPPLIPLIYSLGNFFAHPDLGYRILALTINVASVIAIYFLGRRIADTFLGLIAAILFGFSYAYFFHGIRILLDVPLTFFHILLAYALFRINASSTKKDHIFVGIMGLCIILIKISGVLIIPWIVLYYLISLKELRWKKRFKLLFWPLLLIFLSLGYLLIKNQLLIGRAIPSTSALTGVMNPRPFWHYFYGLDYLLPANIIPFLFLGIIYTFKCKPKASKFLLSWLLIYFVTISAVSEKQFRYFFPLLPCIILLTCLGIECIINSISRKNHHFQLILRILVLFLIILTVKAELRLIIANMNANVRGYTGFPEASAWLKHSKQQNTLIITGFPRVLRYYMDSHEPSNLNIRLLPETQLKFEEIINDTMFPVCLQLDRWNFFNRPWLYPLTSEKRSYLRSFGFKLEKKIIRPDILDKSGKTANTAVIEIFCREKINLNDK